MPNSSFVLYFVFQLQNEVHMTYDINLYLSEDTPLEYEWLLKLLEIWVLEVKICTFLPSLSSYLPICRQEFCGLHHTLRRQRDRQHVNIDPGGLHAEGIEGDVLCTKPASVALWIPSLCLMQSSEETFPSSSFKEGLMFLWNIPTNAAKCPPLAWSPV